jgi:hypothetical protein
LHRRPVDELFDQLFELCRSCLSGNYLVIGNASSSQCLLLDGVTRCSRALMVSAALILDRMSRLAILIN